jgi:hypothetical protein
MVCDSFRPEWEWFGRRRVPVKQVRQRVRTNPFNPSASDRSDSNPDAALDLGRYLFAQVEDPPGSTLTRRRSVSKPPAPTERFSRPERVLALRAPREICQGSLPNQSAFCWERGVFRTGW